MTVINGVPATGGVTSTVLKALTEIQMVAADIVSVTTCTSNAVFYEPALQARLTSIAVTGGASGVITFINATDGVRANIAAADQQLSWQSNGGIVTLAATKTIVITLVGTGATAVALTVSIEYTAQSSGGYLA